MSDINYKQCRLIKKGAEDVVVWIPEKFAVVGKFLRIKKNDGWQVKEVFEVVMKEKYILARERDYTKSRSATDI